MTGEPAAHGATTSHDGDGITICDDAHCCPHATEGVRGMPDVVPDVPAHLPLTAGRALRAQDDREATGRERAVHFAV
ncbi:hypothetical protein [Streptomyces sp. B1I3]|uniref:hypothetical protein n=1 Tax=Streptomyces sp. B1I3 TaxID=3042264 RepID=UPI002789545A|nr:hypothetical protein [Streptomyces sp. B1I3]MDQ0793385.1 hypothetical protein [Streptomyces sp. B1I3]